MTLHVSKAEIPSELRESMTIQFGAVVEPVEVTWHNPSVAQAAAPGNGLAVGRLALATVSNPRPELVSGGEVLVRVDVPDHTNPADVQVTSDGRNVTSGFQVQSDGSLLGLITGLRIGRNRLVAAAHGQFASLDVTDHSINGPVFSGR